jgi:hypothetical protein
VDQALHHGFGLQRPRPDLTHGFRLSDRIFERIKRLALSGGREKLAIIGSRSPMAQNAAIGNLACVLTTIAKVRFRASLLIC